MAAIAGWQCQVYLSTASIIGNMVSAEIAVAGDIYDITQLGGQWKLKIGGLVDYTVKLTGNFDMADGQQGLMQGYMITTPGSIATWGVAPKGMVPTQRYSGTMILKSMGFKFPVGGKQEITFDGESTGALVFVA